MKIFMTGATGVIGQRAVPALIGLGHQVSALARSAERHRDLEKMGATPVDVSMFDPVGLRDAVAGHDAVINLATHIPSSSFRMLFHRAWSENDRLRREGSTNLVAAALASSAQLFVQESFAPAYPDCGAAFIDETEPLDPNRYNRTLVDAEESADRFTASGRRGVILRFGGFYGPDAGALTDMVRLVRHGWLPLPGPANAFLSSVSHDDAATAVVAALGLRAGIYNVTDDEPVSHRAYADALAAALHEPAPKLPPTWSTFFTGSLGRLLSRSIRASNRKLCEASDWRPRYRSVREGFRALAGTWETQSHAQHPLASS